MRRRATVFSSASALRRFSRSTICRMNFFGSRRRLARFCSYGDFFFCHAGIRPGRPLEDQDPDDLIWIRGEFHRWPRLYDKVVVHGHTPHSEPEVLANRVNVDTGAWQTGVLTALAVDGQDKRILQVEG